jgi:hypothetical protein
MNARVSSTAPDSGRLALAAAIEARALCERDAEACRSALQRASEMVRSSETRAEAAKDALESALSSLSNRMAEAAATGVTLAPDMAMRAARAEQIDAADSVAAAISAMAVVEAKGVESADLLRRAQGKVDDAVKAVAACSVPALIAAAEADRDALGRSLGVLRVFLVQTGDVHLSKKIQFLLNAAPPDHNEQAGTPWRQWIESLSRDADSPAPL